MMYGCCTGMENYTLLEETGYDCIELSGRELSEMSDAQADEVSKLISSRRLPCCGLNAFLPADVALLGPEYDRSKLELYCKKVLARAQKLGAKTVGIGSPLSRMLPTGFSKRKAASQFNDALETISVIASRHAMIALLEPICAGECNYINRTDEALALLNNLSLPNLFLLYDIYHSVQMGEDASIIDTAIPWIRHVHICQPDRLGHHFLSREGTGAFAGHLSRLLRAGYDGIISIEALTGNLQAEACKSLLVLQTACGDDMEQKGGII